MKSLVNREMVVLLIACAISTVGLVHAQEDPSKYPTRPINCIVPFSPGGSADLALRLLSKEVEKSIGQPLVVVNRPGGGGSVGVSAVAVAKPEF